MAGRLAPWPLRQRGLLQPGHRWRLPRRGRSNFLPAEDATLRAAGALGPGCGGRRLLFLLRRHGKRRSVLSCLLRAHVVPSNEEGDGVRVVNRLNGDAGRRRMERASGFHDLSDDRKARDRSGCEARGPLLQIDGILDVLRDDEVCIARSLALRERGDEVGDRPSVLRLESIEEPRHGRAVQPGAHGPEDILAG